MGTSAGATKTAAMRIGMALEDYRARIAAGEKWCTACTAFHATAQFAADRSRADGLQAVCRVAQAARRRAKRVRVPRQRGRRFVPARDGDREQARGRVNHLVRMGVLPRPNDIPCADCGHVYREGERRHEYDHHLGYAPEHHEHVEAVCTSCHAIRAQARGENPAFERGRKRSR